MEAGSDEEVQQAAMQVLRNIYGDAVKEPVACAVSRWGSDPYSKGQSGIRQTMALIDCDDEIVEKDHVGTRAAMLPYLSLVYACSLS